MDRRKRLTDILRDRKAQDLQNLWNRTAAAADFALIPPGSYQARVVGGELFNSKKNGTEGYKLTFELTDGDYQGRRIWHALWLTPAALPMSKRDLGKLGITDLSQLDSPLPPGILCTIKVAVRRDDDGNEVNHVRTFEFTGIDSDPFAPEVEKKEEKP